MIYQETKNNSVLTIDFDKNPLHPRKDQDNIGVIYQIGLDRYNIGDKKITSEEMEEIANNPDNYRLPIYCYIHSGITISHRPFNDNWDSGMLGYIVISKEICEKEGIPFSDKDRLGKICLNEIKEYNAYLIGMVYQWTIKDNNDWIDSCGSYTFEGDAITEGADSFNRYLEDKRDEILGYKAN
jgi:hypothetical protein